MADAQIAGKAQFELIRYAQLWEDADVLVDALPSKPGATFVSICSGGDNALAMLLLDPDRVVALDLSPAQISCLRLRIEAYRKLSHVEFLELTGSRPSSRRGELLARAASVLEDADQAFWASRRESVAQYGIGGIGKFETYFRTFRTWLLPLAHNRKTLDDVFNARPQADRQTFFDERWNNWRWRLLLGFFFSNFVMGRLGRDPSFFAYVEGSLAEHVSRRLIHAAIDLDPSENPYLHWILKGCHGVALPLAWREEHYDTIRQRLDRLDLRCGALEQFVETGERADGYNLSDIFEYMDAATFETVYGSLLKAANPGCRLVYWNMMAPRRVPERWSKGIRTLTDIEARGKSMDKAFFYSDFIVEEVL